MHSTFLHSRTCSPNRPTFFLSHPQYPINSRKDIENVPIHDIISPKMILFFVSTVKVISFLSHRLTILLNEKKVLSDFYQWSALCFTATQWLMSFCCFIICILCETYVHEHIRKMIEI